MEKMKAVVLNRTTENDPEAEILDYSMVKARTKSLHVSYLLCFTLGVFGLHHFYLRRLGFGFIYMLTGGLFFMGWIVDIFRLPKLVRSTNDKIIRANRDSSDLNQLEKEKILTDAYIMSLPPFGILGFHHFYLERYGFGFLYLCTLGLFGFGWLLDLFRMPHLVMRANKTIQKALTAGIEAEAAQSMVEIGNLETNTENQQENGRILGRKRLDDAIVLSYGPAGLLGFHQFYFGNLLLGFLYMLTLANFGICWVADMVRIRSLVQETNWTIEGKLEGERKNTLQAYLLWLPPAGLLGAHQFYLDRPCSALIRSATLGLFLVGWIYDFFAIPEIVKRHNLKQQLQEYMTEVEQEMSQEQAQQIMEKSFDPQLVNPFTNCFQCRT